MPDMIAREEHEFPKGIKRKPSERYFARWNDAASLIQSGYAVLAEHFESLPRGRNRDGLDTAKSPE